MHALSFSMMQSGCAPDSLANPDNTDARERNEKKDKIKKKQRFRCASQPFLKSLGTLDCGGDGFVP